MAITEKKILFLCSENAVRSPIAQALMQQVTGPTVQVYSAGVQATHIHPFAIAVMMERGINLMNHESHTYDELGERDFDLIVALSQPAWDLARTIAKGTRAIVEYWDTPAPPDMSDNANREQMMDAYRRIRDDIARHIANRFNLSVS
jgi:protein-tyrosine-phosphatase